MILLPDELASEPRRSRTHVAIIGGGISGVAAAYELSRARAEARPAFTLFEAADRLGGIVETVRKGGFTVECGPDSWVSEKPWARELAEELGLRDDLVPSQDDRRRTYLASGTALQPLPDGMRMMVPTRWEPLLHSPLFTWEAKLAYLREPKRAEELKESALAARGADADESIEAFVMRHFGEEVTQTVARPLLSGVFGGEIARLSVRAAMAPFVHMEAEHGSLIRGLMGRHGEKPEPIFTTLLSGLGTLVDGMAAHLPPRSVHLNEPVHALRREGNRWAVETERGTQHFDEVLLATSLDATGRLLRSSGLAPAQAIAALLPTGASSAVVAAFGYPAGAATTLRIPRGFGFLVRTPPGPSPADTLLACTFMEQKFPGRVPEGGVLLRAFFGGAAAERLLGEADEVIAGRARQQLSRLIGSLPPAALTVVRRWPRSLPQYAVGHLRRMRELAAEADALPHLQLLGNAYRGVGLGELVRDARAAARTLLPG